MAKGQPKIAPPRSSLQNSLDLIAGLGLVGFVIFFMLEWPPLAETVPTHFNSDGEPDGYGSKYALLLLPFIALGNFFLFYYLNQRPHSFNYPVTITEANAEQQYILARNMMSALNTVIVLGLFYICWKIVGLIKGEVDGLGTWFMPIFLGFTFLPIVGYMIASKRIQ